MNRQTARVGAAQTKSKTGFIAESFDDATRSLMLDSTQRPAAFLQWANAAIRAQGLANAAPRIWADMLQEWSGFDRIDHARFESLLHRLRRHRPSVIGAALPGQPLKVYRGQAGSAPIGLSWTRSTEVANAFARGHRMIPVPNAVVLMREVAPTDIAFVVDDRREQEVVLYRRAEVAR